VPDAAGLLVALDDVELLDLVPAAGRRGAEERAAGVGARQVDAGGDPVPFGDQVLNGGLEISASTRPVTDSSRPSRLGSG